MKECCRDERITHQRCFSNSLFQSYCELQRLSTKKESKMLQSNSCSWPKNHLWNNNWPSPNYRLHSFDQPSKNSHPIINLIKILFDENPHQLIFAKITLSSILHATKLSAFSASLVIFLFKLSSEVIPTWMRLSIAVSALEFWSEILNSQQYIPIISIPRYDFV